MSWTLLNPATTKAELQPSFAEQDFGYCQALSEALLKAPQSRDFPDLIALGFWLRQANLKPLLAPYQHSQHFIRQPLGLVFHSAPANVDSLFVYSGILSLLCGNKNVIRLSSRSGGSTAVLIEKIRALAELFPAQNARFQLVQCSYDSAELKALVSTVDGRVLWGSDQAIQAQRQLLMPAHARELSFGHKFSLCLLDADAVLAADNEQLQQLVQLFYRDQLTFAQQGCSSAKAVLWLGETAQVQQAQQRFWPALTELIEHKQPLNSSEQYQALATAQQLVMSSPQQLLLTQQQSISRLAVNTLTPEFIQQHQGCGLFLELALTELTQLNPMLSHAHQTLTVWGVDPKQLKAWLTSVHTGLDRVMPVGQALSFSPDWDGMNLIEQFSRKVVCTF
ncbi:acyl-CoA reductase [Rheinheimera mesophila]|uniref:long-chain-fatty-acyl-CoA reductase n=1 Tax=Rheinheimera mesophila TaxID=1547515 RepID=A0A3P3QSG8_9GAMM|nr:acyl-CoA reductase [Rheinheimera mesophila]KKL01546.1 acyl-CoA reductase [Rheinheimera mesophila]RRJ23193.1 acyl-CoA reductase [Rheinheimera mesophila]